MRKADQIRARLEVVASWRLEGRTWPEIADTLRGLGVEVSGDEIRSYWPRLAEGMSPAMYMLYHRDLWRGEELDRRDGLLRLADVEAEAKASAAEVARLTAALDAATHRAATAETAITEVEDRAEAQAKASAAEVARLAAALDAATHRAAAAETAITEVEDQAKASAAEVARLTAALDAATHRAATAETAITEAQAWASAAEEDRLRGALAAAEAAVAVLEAEKAPTLAAVHVQEIRLAQMAQDLAAWVAFGRRLAVAQAAGDTDAFRGSLSSLAEWHVKSAASGGAAG